MPSGTTGPPSPAPPAELLRSVVARLSRRPGSLDIARAIAEITPPALDARTAVVVLPDAHGRPTVAATAGHRAEGEAVLRQLVDYGARVPVTEALRTGHVLTVGTRAELLHRFPDAARLPVAFEAIVAVPCLHDGGPVAAIAWGFAQARDFDPQFLALARELGGYCGVALARGTLFDARQRRTAQLVALEQALTAMAVAADVDGVVAAAASHGPAVTGARGVAAVVADPDGGLAVHAAGEVAHRRVTSFLAATDRPGPGTDGGTSPVAASVRGGATVTLAGDAPGQTWVVVPFARPAVVPGALLLRYAHRPVGGEGEVALRATLAQALGQALARAVLAAGAGAPASGDALAAGTAPGPGGGRRR